MEIDIDKLVFSKYLRRQQDLVFSLPKDYSVLSFLKPNSRVNFQFDDILSALRAFGFKVEKLEEKTFNAMELRLLWRNLRDIKAWSENAFAYERFVTPIISLSIDSNIPIIYAIDNFKRKFRERYSGASTDIENFLHAPADIFEVKLHEVIFSKNNQSFYDPRILRVLQSRFQNLQKPLKKDFSFYFHPNMFDTSIWSEGNDTLDGLMAVKIDDLGKVSTVFRWGESQWNKDCFSTVSDEELYRLIYNGTFVSGSKKQYMQCFNYYKWRHIFNCFDGVDSITNSNFSFPDIISFYRYFLLPSPIKKDIVSDIENEVYLKFKR